MAPDPLTEAIRASAEELDIDIDAIDEPEDELEEEPVEEVEEVESDEDETDPADEDEEDEEGEEDDEEDEDEDEESEPVELDDDAVVIIDGEERTGKDVREGFLRQQDYTRKTQELAEQRRALETFEAEFAEYLQARQDNPGAWVQEIVGDDPREAVDILSHVVGESENPTLIAAVLIQQLAERDKLSEEFIEAFGLEKLKGTSRRSQEDDRIARLERQVKEREQAEQKAAQEQAERREALQGFITQWGQLKQQYGIETQDEQADFVDLLTFAHSERMTNLESAYILREARAGRVPAKGAAPASKSKKREAVKKRKKQAGVTTKRSAGSGTTRPPAKGLDAAIVAAEEEFDAKRRQRKT